MVESSDIEQLKKDLFSDDWKLMQASSEQLRDIGGEEVFHFFIDCLDLGNSRNRTRNIAALRLKEIGDNRALEPLLAAILKKENINYNGTLVYALSGLDCTHKLCELFEMLFYHGYEAKLGAYNIISEQIFEFTRQDILSIASEWEDLKKTPERCPAFNDAKALIEDCVQGFLPYLDQS